MTIADFSWMGNDFEALLKQLEEIDGLIQLGNSCTSHWISSENWNQIRDWVSRMIGRIVGPHRSQSTWSYDYTDIEESFETIYLPTNQKRFVFPLSFDLICRLDLDPQGLDLFELESHSLILVS